jgi:hypothetical protein
MKTVKPKFKFKRDAYMRARGTPAMLKINCALCTTYLMRYQKDGPGPLKRCYLDRIHHPEELEKRQYILFDKNTALHLKCSTCNVAIGTPIVYEKENRPAYHMRAGFFIIEKRIRILANH